MGFFRWIACTTLTVAALAGPEPAGATEPIPWRSARVQGMGGWAVADPQGADTLWQNPAALAVREPGLRVDVVNASADVSDGTRRATRNGRNFEDPDALLRDTAASDGRPLSAGASLFPNLRLRGLGAGVLVGGSPEARVVGGEDAHVDVAGRATAGAVFGAAHAVAQRRIAVGLSAKGLKRVSYAERFDDADGGGTDGDASAAGPVQEGLTASLDAGALVRLPGALRPSMGVHVADLAATALPDPWPAVADAAPYDASRLTPNVTAGVAVAPSFGSVDVRGTLNVTDLTAETLQWDRNLHAGVEVRPARMVALRGGLSQGRPSVGAGVDLRHIRVDGAWFAQRSLTNPDVVDRQLLVQMSAGF